MRCTWQSMTPAVRILPLPAIISVLGADDKRRVDAVHDVGVAGFADGDDAAVAHTDVSFHDPPVIEHDRAGDDEVGRAFGTRHASLAHRLADDLAAAEDRLVAGRPGLRRGRLRPR